MAQHKFTLKELLELNKHLGVDVEIVEDEAQSDFKRQDEPITIDALLTAIDTGREPIISNKIKGSIEGELNRSISGKVSAAVKKTLIEATGISKDKIEGKDTKEAVQIAISHYAEALGTDKKSAADQLKEVMEAHAKELDAEREGRKTDKGDFESKLSQHDKNNILSSYYGGAKGIDPKANKSVLQEDFLLWLERSYNVKVNEDKKGFTLYDKANPEKVALNQSNTQVVNWQDVAKDYHTSRGQWHEDSRRDNPADTFRSEQERNTRQETNYNQPANNDKAVQDMVAQWAGGN